MNWTSPVESEDWKEVVEKSNKKVIKFLIIHKLLVFTAIQTAHLPAQVGNLNWWFRPLCHFGPCISWLYIFKQMSAFEIRFEDALWNLFAYQHDRVCVCRGGGGVTIKGRQYGYCSFFLKLDIPIQILIPYSFNSPMVNKIFGAAETSA